MYPSEAKLVPRRCNGCQVSMTCPSLGQSKYVQKNGAVSRAIFGAFANMFNRKVVEVWSCRERWIFSGYRNVLTRCK